MEQQNSNKKCEDVKEEFTEKEVGFKYIYIYFQFLNIIAIFFFFI